MDANRGGYVGDEAVRIVPNKRRFLQVAPTRRKLFDAAARSEFLEWLAATCNVSLAARKTGFHYRTPLRHRIEDPLFREAFERALRQGLARLEARLLEIERTELPIGIEGDRDAPEAARMDPWLAIQLLREHRRNLAAPEGRRPGRMPRAASHERTAAGLERAVANFAARNAALGEAEEGEGKGGRGGDASSRSALG